MSAPDFGAAREALKTAAFWMEQATARNIHTIAIQKCVVDSLSCVGRAYAHLGLVDHPMDNVIAQRDEITRYALALLASLDHWPNDPVPQAATEALRAACSRMPVPMGNYADLEEALDALRALFDQCAMVHKHWGEGCNRAQADSAQKAALAILAKHGRA